jgi:general secretion pathway protein D
MMKGFLASVGLVMALCSPIAPAVDVQPPSFDFTSLPVNQVISLYYKEVSKRPYFICSDVLSDNRIVSVRASGKTLDGPLFASILASHGYEVRDKDGVTVICRKTEAAIEQDTSTFLYKVKHRDSAYLVDFLSPLVKGTFANKRAAGGSFSVGGSDKTGNGLSPGSPAPAASSSAYRPAVGDDYIVFTGTDKEIARLEKLLAQLDTPTGEVLVKAYMYEVGTNASESSALDIVVSALSGKFQVGAGGSSLANFVRLKTSSIDLIASALKTDGRFKVVTAPFVRLRSGKTARFVSGAQVSVLGAIVTNQGGTTQQSFDRVESGTILEVSPVVREQSFDVDLFQQVSSFVRTESGGSTPPTLNKRELRTSLTMEDGEVVVIAGLNESTDENTNSGLWFLPVPFSKNQSNRSSELVLVLELKRI